MPPMPQMTMPPGMGMVPPMAMMAGGPPRPGIHMGMEPLPGMTHDHLKMAHHRGAMMLHEEMAIHQVRVGGIYKQYPLHGILY